MADGMLLRKMFPKPQPKEDDMIARLWTGATLADRGEEYAEYVNKTGIEELRATPGNQGTYLLRRQNNGRCEFLVISLWESKDAIRSFAGEDLERARYYPRDPDYLLQLEPNVTHFEIVEPGPMAGASR